MACRKRVVIIRFLLVVLRNPRFQCIFLFSRKVSKKKVSNRHILFEKIFFGGDKIPPSSRYGWTFLGRSNVLYLIEKTKATVLNFGRPKVSQRFLIFKRREAKNVFPLLLILWLVIFFIPITVRFLSQLQSESLFALFHRRSNIRFHLTLHEIECSNRSRRRGVYVQNTTAFSLPTRKI